jgi:hypothetical protein
MQAIHQITFSSNKDLLLFTRIFHKRTTTDMAAYSIRVAAFDTTSTAKAKDQLGMLAISIYLYLRATAEAISQSLVG